jgi:putative transposase
MTNERERQTYYGALDYSSKEFIVKGYATANSENTVDF